jgi:hypothetical protein
MGVISKNIQIQHSCRFMQSTKLESLKVHNQ